MVSAQSMTLTTDGTLTGTHNKTITATYNSASLHCVLEVICITFVGEDMAGHKLTNPTTCRSFSPTDSEDYPGWFMLHNVGTGPSSVSLARPLGLNCMDSSVDTQACANSASVTSTTLEYGNYLALDVSSGYPIGITDISVDGNSVLVGVHCKNRCREHRLKILVLLISVSRLIKTRNARFSREIMICHPS